MYLYDGQVGPESSRLSLLEQPDARLETTAETIQVVGSIVVGYSFDQPPRFRFINHLTGGFQGELPRPAAEVALAAHQTFIAPLQAPTSDAEQQFRRDAARRAVYDLSSANQLTLGSFMVTETEGRYNVQLLAAHTLIQAVDELAKASLRQYHEEYRSGAIPHKDVRERARLLGAYEKQSVRDATRARLVAAIIAYGLPTQDGLRAGLQLEAAPAAEQLPAHTEDFRSAA
jgi:hypothetical protein